MNKKEGSEESEKAIAEVAKLIEMRDWIDNNFPKFYRPYERRFIDKAKDIGLNPHTIRAFKREFEMRFGINLIEWMVLHTLLHFSAMRQGGVNSRFVRDKEGIKQIKVVMQTAPPEYQPLLERMMLLMWDVLEMSAEEEQRKYKDDESGVI